jgi:hypothetical protein
MNELAEALIAESYAAPPAHILESLTDDLAHQSIVFLKNDAPMTKV